MSPDVYGAIVVIGLVWVWAGVLWFLPSPAPRVELVDRDEEEV